MNSFLEAAGVVSPWQLSIESQSAPKVTCPSFSTPFVVIGRESNSDLCLAHKDVSERHALLQWIDGHLYVVDLGSRNGVLWEGQRQRSGWLAPGSTIRIGPYRIGLSPGSVPLDRAQPPRLDDPTFQEVALDIKLRGIRSIEGRVQGRFALLGSAAECDVRLLDPTVATYHCAIVNTAQGVWLVDLLAPQGGTIVNHEEVRCVCLTEGATFEVGRSAIRVAGAEAAATRSMPEVAVPEPVVTRSTQENAPVAVELAPAVTLPTDVRPSAIPSPHLPPVHEVAAVSAPKISQGLGRSAALPWSRHRGAGASSRKSLWDEPAAADETAPDPTRWVKSRPPQRIEPESVDSRTGKDRRTSCRYSINNRRAEISWFDANPAPALELKSKSAEPSVFSPILSRIPGFRGAATALAARDAVEPIEEEKPIGREAIQNRTVVVSLVDVSHAGLAVLSPAVPPRGERVWFRLENSENPDWIELTTVGASTTPEQLHLVRFAFRESCPYDLFKSLVFERISARTEDRPE